MSSRQEQRVEGEAQAQRAGEQIARAEAHAREAAREITHERTERARVVGAGGGILETVQQGARSLVSAVGRTLGVASRDTTKDSQAKARQSTEELSHKAASDDKPTSPMEEDTTGEYKQLGPRNAMEYLTLQTEEQSKASVDATEQVARQELAPTRERTEQLAEADRRWN